MRLLTLSFSAAALAFTASACTTPAPLVDDNYGYAKETSIEVCMPKGERAYLNRLICADGKAPTYYRVGNVGERTELVLDEPLTHEQERQLERQIIDPNYVLQEGEVDYHIIDKYEVSCGAEKFYIFMDMYHCEQPMPTRAPNGFTFKP